MKTTLSLFLLLFVLIFNTACPKPERIFNGTWIGPLSPLNNLSKSLSLQITSGTNPVSGTYTLGTTTTDVLGDVSGSALGLIYSLTLKPKTASITYTINATWGDDDTFAGTMKGTENGKAVTYDFVLKRQ